MRCAIVIAVLLLAQPSRAAERWTGAWATSQQVPEPRNALTPGALADATLRQTVRLTLGGSGFRVRLSNAFGTAPLRLTAHAARALRAGESAIDPASDHALTFSGSAEAVIPAGAEYVSDPVAMTVTKGEDIAITLHFAAEPAQQTSHPGSRTTSFLVHGDHLADATLAGAGTFEHWFNIAGIDVTGPARGAVSVIGDSITDGRGSTTNSNDRWTDALAARLSGVGVLNHGIGGGRILLDGLGPNAMARLYRDLLAQPGVRWGIVFEAVNDIGTFDPKGEKSAADHAELVRQITAAYRQMAETARAAGIRLYGATITPFLDCDAYHPTAQAEADRQAVNVFIRSSGVFDAVLDFDRAVADLARPDHLAARYDSGDHLHLSPEGYRGLAAAVPVSLFH